MKEVLTLLEYAHLWQMNGTHFALATLVTTSGSTYKRPGARSLISEHGEVIGLLSGGCLEGDIATYVPEVLATGCPKLLTYDLTSDADIVFGLGLGCNGKLQILLEAVYSATSPASDCNVISILKKYTGSESNNAFLATAFQVDSKGTPIRTGQNFLSFGSDFAGPTSLSFPLQNWLQQQLTKLLKFEKNFTATYEHQADQIDFLFEKIPKRLSLLIFGAGADVIPLTRFCLEMGWEVTLVDHRANLLSNERFPGGCSFVPFSTEVVQNLLQKKAFDAVVLMTHDYLRDKEILTQCCKEEVKTSYLGLLGPKARGEKILQEMSQEERNIPDFILDKIFSPTGLDLGGDGPEAIALSIVAEILAVTQKRTGGSLKLRSSPIHER